MNPKQLKIKITDLKNEINNFECTIINQLRTIIHANNIAYFSNKAWSDLDAYLFGLFKTFSYRSIVVVPSSSRGQVANLSYYNVRVYIRREKEIEYLLILY